MLVQVGAATCVTALQPTCSTLGRTSKPPVQAWLDEEGPEGEDVVQTWADGGVGQQLALLAHNLRRGSSHTTTGDQTADGAREKVQTLTLLLPAGHGTAEADSSGLHSPASEVFGFAAAAKV